MNKSIANLLLILVMSITATNALSWCEQSPTKVCYLVIVGKEGLKTIYRCKYCGEESHTIP